MSNQISEKVIEIISKFLGIPPEEINPEDDLFQDLNAQKMEVADIILALEEEFKIKISPEEQKEIRTIGDLINLVFSSYEFS